MHRPACFTDERRARAESRPACVDLPALPLQLLLRRRPEWTGRPVAVVAENSPRGLVLLADRRARDAGIKVGMRHGAALSLVPSLCAEAVTEDETAAGVAAATKRLHGFTPGVEPSEEAGVFFLDASGLSRLHGSLDAWARALVESLRAEGFRARIAVGFTRFGVYAAAKAARGVVVFESAEEETRFARRVPIPRLGVDAKLAEVFEKLDVRTVADFLRLPEESLLRRFGADAAKLRRFAQGGQGAPLARATPFEPLVERAAWEHPETDATRLVFPAKRLVDRVIARAAARGEALTELTLRFVLDRHPPREERLAPAAPTLDVRQILDLVHLRLATLRFDSGVVELTLSATSLSADEEQLRLFVQRPRRDPAAAARAFARLRAEFGEDAVVVARLADAHLPEARFVWERIDALPAARPKDVAERTLVRRVFARPVPLRPRPRHEPDGFLVADLADGPAVRVSPACLVCTGWWTGAETRREYEFVETSRGRLWWTYAEADGRRFGVGRAE